MRFFFGEDRVLSFIWKFDESYKAELLVDGVS
jgi:hypothetical protein